MAYESIDEQLEQLTKIPEGGQTPLQTVATTTTTQLTTAL